MLKKYRKLSFENKNKFAIFYKIKKVIDVNENKV